MRNAQKGFTIVEVTLSVAISAIIILGVFGILQASNRQLEMIHGRMSLQEGPREALFKMAQEIRQAPQKVGANRILITEDGILNVGPDAGGIERAGMITFSVPTAAALVVDGFYEPVWSSNIQYRLDEDTHQILRISEDIVTHETREAVLANEVTALEFSRNINAPGLITITASAQRELPDGRRIPDEPIQMTAQAETRNP